MTSSSSRNREDERESLEREVGMLARALEDRGELGRDALRTEVAARSWGPGRFGRALKEAVSRRAIRRLARDRYGPA
jgi:hypothetical protein